MIHQFDLDHHHLETEHPRYNKSVFSILVRSKYLNFSGEMTFVLSICFNVLQSSQKASIEHSEQVRSCG